MSQSSKTAFRFTFVTALLALAVTFSLPHQRDQTQTATAKADAQQATEPLLAFFSPAGYPTELAQHTHLGIINVLWPDDLRQSFETARTHGARLQIDFAPLILQQRPAEQLNRHYTHEGKQMPKSFEPLAQNKIKNLPNREQLRSLFKPYWPLLKEYQDQIATIFLSDEPYMHGISKEGMAQLSKDFRHLLQENHLPSFPLGITFSAAMFDARFAQMVDAQASAWVHDVEQYAQRLRQSTQADEREQWEKWSQAFKAQRLTTYDLAGHYYTGGGIPEGYDVIRYNLYTATLLQDAVHRKTLAWFAELGISPACRRFHGLDMSQIRAQLSFYQDGAVEPNGLEKDRPLLNDIFLCKSETLLHLLKAHAPNQAYQLQLIAESSANGFMEFDAQGNIEADQPQLLVAARVQEEVERTLQFYDRYRKEFDAGVMFFVWDDTVDETIDLHILGARSMPGVTNLVFERIGKK